MFIFLAGVAAVAETTDVRQNIEGDRVRINSGGHRVAIAMAACTCCRSSAMARAPVPETAW